MEEIWEFVKKELFSPVLAIILGQLIISIFAEFAKLKKMNKLLPARTVIWKCPHIKSQKVKYTRFLLDLLLIILLMFIVESIIYITLIKGLGFQESVFEKQFVAVGVGLLVFLIFINNAKEPLEEIFGHKEMKMIKERIFLNGPFILMILMYAFMFTKYSELTIIILGIFFWGFQIGSFYLLDGKTEFKYEKARIYLNNYLKYKDVISSSISEEKKWLSFTYVEYGKEYEARVLKSTVERVEYYNE